MNVIVGWLLIAGLYLSGWKAVQLMGRPQRPPAVPYDWAAERPVDELAEWERQIRTPGLLEDACRKELGL